MLQELNSREADGVTVTLYWDDTFGTTTIHVVDDRTETDATFDVPASAAADAFHHPFCYLELAAAARPDSDQTFTFSLLPRNSSSAT